MPSPGHNVRIWVAVFTLMFVWPGLAQEEMLGQTRDEAQVELETLGPVSTPLATSRGPGTVLLTDNFQNPAAGRLPSDGPNVAQPVRSYEDGEYRLQRTESGGGAAVFATVPGTFTDASMAVDARLVGDASGRLILLTCRRQGDADAMYLVRFDPVASDFQLVRRDYGSATTLAYVQALAIRSGNAVNRLELICTGRWISVAVNDLPLAQVEDGTYFEGRWELGIGTDRQQGEARFDNLQVTQTNPTNPPPAPGPPGPPAYFLPGNVPFPIADRAHLERAEVQNAVMWDVRRFLTWSDFQGVDGQRASIDAWYTGTAFFCDAGRLLSTGARTYMRKDGSWVGTAALTPNVLRHEQGHFDIWELFGRRLRQILRDSICSDLTNGRLQARIDEVLARLKEAHIDYDALTLHGTLQSAQQTESERIERELAATADQ